jgi:CMP-N,N'-diacetyllegionaminic acid synthase
MAFDCLVIIPARGGSKRIPHKNIVSLCGKPLLLYTIDCVKEAGLLDVTVVSTEDSSISRIASEAGVGVISRPLELAADNTSTEAVLLDVVGRMRLNQERLPEWVITLPPTSPLRSSETLLKFLHEIELASQDTDCLMSITENRGDFWHYVEDGSLKRLFPNAPRRQQDRAPIFEENSAIYCTRISSLIETGSILGKKVEGIVIDPLEALDINTLEDLNFAEALIAKNSKEII